MTRIHCSNYDCKHIDPNTELCEMDAISVGDEYFGGCDDYESFYNTKEYGEEFYIAVKTKDKTVGKALKHGKKIEYNGRVFYTTDRVTEDESYYVTDKRTGLNVGKFKMLKDRWETFLQKEKDIPDVETYPLARLIGREWEIAN